jgi:hypothetical protein
MRALCRCADLLSPCSASLSFGFGCSKLGLFTGRVDLVQGFTTSSVPLLRLRRCSCQYACAMGFSLNPVGHGHVQPAEPETANQHTERMHASYVWTCPPHGAPRDRLACAGKAGNWVKTPLAARYTLLPRWGGCTSGWAPCWCCGPRTGTAVTGAVGWPGGRTSVQ